MPLLQLDMRAMVSKSNLVLRLSLWPLNSIILFYLSLETDVARTVNHASSLHRTFFCSYCTFVSLSCCLLICIDVAENLIFYWLFKVHLTPGPLGTKDKVKIVMHRQFFIKLGCCLHDICMEY